MHLRHLASALKEPADCGGSVSSREWHWQRRSLLPSKDSLRGRSARWGLPGAASVFRDGLRAAAGRESVSLPRKSSLFADSRGAMPTETGSCASARGVGYFGARLSGRSRDAVPNARYQADANTEFLLRQARSFMPCPARFQQRLAARVPSRNFFLGYWPFMLAIRALELEQGRTSLSGFVSACAGNK